MASTTRPKKRGLTNLLTLRAAARLLEYPVDELLRLPGVLPIVIDLAGPRKLNPRRMKEEDFEYLRVREDDLDAWLESHRYGAAEAAGAAA